MYLLYMGLMILLKMSGYDVVNEYQYQAWLGVVLSAIAGILKIWRSVSY